jgi:hypothetical protein
MNRLSIQDRTRDSFKQDTTARKMYANRIYWLVVGWIAAMFVIIFLQGFQLWGWKPIADTVLGVLVGTSTISVLGILATVAKYIFRVPSQPNQ